LNSATSGLHLAIAQLKATHGWQEGDEIITTPLTFVSTNHAILYEKLTPVFADVDQYVCLDPESVKARITPKTRAVIFVGVGGNGAHVVARRKMRPGTRLQPALGRGHLSWASPAGKPNRPGGRGAVFQLPGRKKPPNRRFGDDLLAD